MGHVYGARLVAVLVVLHGEGWLCWLRGECVTRRQLQTPGTAEEHKRQGTPTINPIGPTDTPHRPSTKHNRKDSPGDA